MGLSSYTLYKVEENLNKMINERLNKKIEPVDFFYFIILYVTM